jgi:Flp pilus assembly protein TadB
MILASHFAYIAVLVLTPPIAPVGRVLSRLSRDVESLDNQLPNALFQLMRMLASGK